MVLLTVGFLITIGLLAGSRGLGLTQGLLLFKGFRVVCSHQTV